MHDVAKTGSNRPLQILTPPPAPTVAFVLLFPFEILRKVTDKITGWLGSSLCFVLKSESLRRRCGCVMIHKYVIKRYVIPCNTQWRS